MLYSAIIVAIWCSGPIARPRIKSLEIATVGLGVSDFVYRIFA